MKKLVEKGERHMAKLAKQLSREKSGSVLEIVWTKHERQRPDRGSMKQMETDGRFTTW